MKTGNGGIYHIPQDLKRPEKALGNGLSGLFQSTEVSNSELYHIGYGQFLYMSNESCGRTLSGLFSSLLSYSNASTHMVVL